MQLIQLTIRNQHGFAVTTTHESQRGANFQRNLTTGEPVEVKPVALITNRPHACEQRRKPRTRRRPA